MKLNFEGHSSFEEVDRIVNEFMSRLSQDIRRNCQDMIFIVVVALRELLNNAVEHGNKLDKNKRIFCEIQCDDKIICIKVKDQGSGFDIYSTMERINNKSTDRDRCRGLFMLKSLGFIVDTADSQVIAKLNI